MSFVMGMDQHRAQISAEWIETMTGEIFRARVAPADRAEVRAFLEQFRGEPLEVALEATTGWRFLVEELQRVGAEVHLAEPAEASALKGKKKRAKTDWADARHLRELLLIGRVPESWIPPAHILDLRARVRGRHLLSHQRTEWQQRMHSVLYHHGCPQRRNVLSVENREWLAGLQLPSRGARADRDLAAHHRRDRYAADPVRPRSPRVCAQTVRLPGADRSDLRRRGADRGHDPRRARRHPTLPQLPRRCPLLGPGHHRLPI